MERDNGRRIDIIGYVDARVVRARLNRVVPGQWSYRMSPYTGPVGKDQDAADSVYMQCQLTVLGVTMSDVGRGADPKAAWSDAIKRAAVAFGVGECLNAMGVPRLVRQGQQPDQAQITLARRLGLDQDLTPITVPTVPGRGGRTRAELTHANQRVLGECYDLWLSNRGTEAFGEPLSHSPAMGEDPVSLTSDGEDTTRDIAEREVDVAGAVAVSLPPRPEAPAGPVPNAPAPEAANAAGPDTEPVAGLVPDPTRVPLIEDLHGTTRILAALEAHIPDARDNHSQARAAATALTQLCCLCPMDPTRDLADTPGVEANLASIEQVITLAGQAGWSLARLEQVLARAAAADMNPTQRLTRFTDHLSIAAQRATEKEAARDAA